MPSVLSIEEYFAYIFYIQENSCIKLQILRNTFVDSLLYLEVI